MRRFAVRLVCEDINGNQDVKDLDFNTEQEIQEWIDKHSYTDIATKWRVQWRVLVKYDTQANYAPTEHF